METRKFSRRCEPPEKQIEWARHPQITKRIKETPAKQQATIPTVAQQMAAQPK